MIAFFSVICSMSVFGQTKTRYWASMGVGYNPTGNYTIGLSVLNGYKEDFNHSFKQYRFSYARRLKNKIYVRPYLSLLYTNSGDKVKRKKRLGLSGTYRIHSSKKIRLYYKHSFEYSSKNESRFRFRMMPQLSMRTKSKKIGKNQRLNLYTNAQLFYRFGGQAISQYDAKGIYKGERKPHGLHRARLSAGVHYRHNNMSVSFSLMRQQEFNLSKKSLGNINQRDYETKKIKHKFKNQNIFTISFRHRITTNHEEDESEIQEVINQ